MAFPDEEKPRDFIISSPAVREEMSLEDLRLYKDHNRRLQTTMHT